MSTVAQLIEKILPEIRTLRRELHAHPELGFEEIETSRKIAERLRRLTDFSLRERVAKTGIVATLGAEKSGPCVALRADMDCLPIEEETGAAYASRRPGLMHACGHDGHTAALVGAALVLHELRAELRGPVKFLFQPAEEGLAGGRVMCEAGALEQPRVDAIFGLHNLPSADLELGKIALRAGPLMGGSCEFRIVVHGCGGHAAMPHTAIDPIFVGSQIVTALQSLVSRRTSPIDSLVVSVTKFHAGTADNIIPDSAELEGTLRALKPELLETAATRLKMLSESLAASLGARAEVRLSPNYPPTVNDARAAAYCAEVARSVAGAANVDAGYPPMLGSEDFSFYLQQRPGAFFFLGTRPAHVSQMPGLHHPKFDFNDDVLPLAIEMHVELARCFAEKWPTISGAKN